MSCTKIHIAGILFYDLLFANRGVSEIVSPFAIDTSTEEHQFGALLNAFLSYRVSEMIPNDIQYCRNIRILPSHIEFS